MLGRYIVYAYLVALATAITASFLYRPPPKWGFAQELSTIPNAFDEVTYASQKR